jgi:ribose/xylose/arabinose/galactoside ABC-type transport system permease subunit
MIYRSMDEIIKLQEVFEINRTNLNPLTLLFNFILTIIFSFIIKIFYTRYSFSLTGKSHIASILPILSCVVFMIIVIIKSSIALSLGLVGALSIVRFRTPIKEPEELVYLFLAIAIGLGFGAGYTLETTLLTSGILTVIFFFLHTKKTNSINEYNLLIDWKNDSFDFDKFTTTLIKYSNNIKLIRLDINESHYTAVVAIEFNENVVITNVINELKKQNNKIEISFFEARNNW